MSTVLWGYAANIRHVTSDSAEIDRKGPGGMEHSEQIKFDPAGSSSCSAGPARKLEPGHDARSELFSGLELLGRSDRQMVQLDKNLKPPPRPVLHTTGWLV
jgi:hypothetical protein